MAGQAGAHEEAAVFASRAADVTPTSEIDRFIRVSLLGYAADLSGDYGRGRTLAAELVDLAEGVDDPGCLIWASLAAARIGMRGAALRHATRAVSFTREQGLVTTLPFCLSVQAAALVIESRFDLAYASAEEGWRLALGTGQPWGGRVERHAPGRDRCPMRRTRLKGARYEDPDAHVRKPRRLRDDARRLAGPALRP
jgi:hypothetical protein